MGAGQIVVRDFAQFWPQEDVLRVECKVVSDDSETELCYQVEGLPRSAELKSADAFLAPCLLYGLGKGADIRFEVPISDTLAQQAGDLLHIFSIQLALNGDLAIATPQTVSLERKARGGITGFSAGVDSWFAVKKHFLDQRGTPKALTHLLINDVGANTSDKKRKQVLSQARQAAEKFGLKLIGVTSNMASFLEMDFQKTHTARNGSVAHLVAPICDSFYYSSTDTYIDSGVFPTYDMAYADTILLPLMSSDAITLHSTGSAFSRAEKTRTLLAVPDIGEMLDVCVYHSHQGDKINCGHCWKCMRTEVTLEAFGALDHFEPVFDLGAYRRKRWRYLREISISRKPTEQEAFKLALEAGLVGSRIPAQFTGTLMKAVKTLPLKKS